ncbi:XdhC family protein [Cryptosporangium minutisporangium]|uniref:YHS domain-containing protein n=1 Tax=Cryptosporangium minutisporangium TaxID=113569 RepID=A0ABP6SV06_9ACTN
MPSIAERAAELARARQPFVQATVVRAGKPASAHPGDTALVRADGAIEGFVGGSCAESSVRVHALAALGTGDPLLLRIEPGAPDTRVEDGAVTVANPCLSGGSLEIFLEPRRPAPRLVVVGRTPIGAALAELGTPLGFAVEFGGSPDDAAAVVVASHGRDEEPAMESALRAGVPYVGLVASRKRGATVIASLEVTDEQRARVHSPAGLDLGGRTAPEVALSILAEIVALRSRPASPAVVVAHPDIDAAPRTTATGSAVPSTADSGSAPPVVPPGTVPLAVLESEAPTAIDPVCGMTVAVVPGALRAASADGESVYFCAEGCRRRYVASAGAQADRG